MEENLYSAILHSAKDACYAVTYDDNGVGICVFANERASYFFGIKKGQSIASIENLSRTDSQKVSESAMENYKTYKTGHATVARISEKTKEGGARVYLTITRTPLIVEGDIKGVVVTAQDVTRLKEDEKYYKTIFRAACHDARSALNPANMHIALIEGLLDDVDEVDEDVFSSLSLIPCFLEESASILNDAIDRINAQGGGAIRRVDYKLRENIINLVVTSMQRRASAKNITFNILEGQEDVWVFVDKPYCKSIFHNLFDNKIKHAGEGAVITVGYEDCGDYHGISVGDNGTPIPEELIPAMFLQNKDGFESYISGTGLGMPLVAKMVRAHGGTISIRGGSTFFFTLLKE